jgi:hypothetical protein
VARWSVWVPCAPVAAVAVALTSLLVAGCSGSSSPTVARPTAIPPTAPVPAAPPSATVPPAVVPAPSGPAAAVPPLVIRPGALPPAQRLAAPRVAFRSPARFPDGLTVTVEKIEHGTVTETGAGAMTGSPRSVFTVRFRNGSTTAVPLDQVVVGVTYGPEHTQAPPIYDASVGDFSGQVPPGGTAAARYAFSVPDAQLGSVVLAVDFDGRHTAAVFAGSAR